jgi:hypothetical protein
MVAIILAACSDSSQGPLSPSVAQRDLNTQQMADRSANGCLSAATVVKDINALYPSAKPMYLAGKAALLYAAELVAVGPIKGVKPDTALGQQIAFQVVDTTLKLFKGGSLIGGQSASTVQLAVTVLDAFLCSAGLPQTLTTASLGTGSTGAAQVVQPNAPTTTVATGDSNAGVQIPQGNLKHTTLVTITPITGPPCVPYAGVLCTPLAQFPPYYQYTFTPSVDSTQTPNPFTYEVCATTTNINVPVADLFLAHNVTNPTTGITAAQVLPKGGTLGLECDTQISMRPASGAGVFELARRGDVRGAVASLASAAEGLFVTDAFAGGTKTSISGTAHSASPFGLVDVNDIIPYQNGQWAYHAPVFTGVPGPMTGDIPAYGPNTAFVPAGSPGWVVSTSPFGTAPFGSGTSADGNQFGCALSNLPNLNLVWPTFYPMPPTTGNLNTDSSSIFLMQATFYIPADWTPSIQIGVAIDNDIQIYLNGKDVTDSGTVAAGTNATYDGSQFLIHEGCATQDSYVITFPASKFNTGTTPNVIAVRARDRGDESYVDLRVAPVTPFVPPFTSP